MKVVELRPQVDAFDLAKTLRNIADEIEADEYGFTPTMAVLVLATENRRQERDCIIEGYNWQTHGIGAGAGYFATKGILASALTRFECGEDQ